MDDKQRAAFEAWYIPLYTSYIPKDEDGNYTNLDQILAFAAWQAALASPEVQALRDALRNLYQAIDSCVELTPEVMRQAQAALAAMEKQK